MCPMTRGQPTRTRSTILPRLCHKRRIRPFLPRGQGLGLSRPMTSHQPTQPCHKVRTSPCLLNNPCLPFNPCLPWDRDMGPFRRTNPCLPCSPCLPWDQDLGPFRRINPCLPWDRDTVLLPLANPFRLSNPCLLSNPFRLPNPPLHLARDMGPFRPTI